MKATKKKISNDQRLVREVGFALACKILFILCLGLLFFGAADRISTNADVVSQAFLPPSDQTTTIKQSE